MDQPGERCGRCGETKPLAEFNRNATTRDGFQSSCRRCMTAYQAAHYRRHREQHIARVREDNARRKATAAAALQAYLRSHPCVDCGTADLRVLEFDHRDAAGKTANLSAMVGMGLAWSRILEEIAKCDVRCANCHRIVTMTRGGHYRGSWHVGDQT